ncbi:SIR4-interacting protein SIF2 [Spathaspora sp. JA1]|nr:SIR4-interacting protein SIF2 [Spathaspora sp. JA1]
MSLTSRELNYLVWRYLQESGYDLSAYALDQASLCSQYETTSNRDIIKEIKPGCLVNLIQKGILFSIAQEEVVAGEVREQPEETEGRLSLLNALVHDHLKTVDPEDKRFLLKSELNGTEETDNMEGIEHNTKQEEEQDKDIEQAIEFTTKIISPVINFPSSLTCDWHPTTKVFAYGKNDGTAVINAISEDKIIESVVLNHSNLLEDDDENDVNIVSWSPQGNLIVTGGINGELRAWSPDGKLKNIANIISEDVNSNPTIIINLYWSSSGQYLISIDSKNQISLWDGNTLSLIKQLKDTTEIPTTTPSSYIATCSWLNEDKFALTTCKNNIKIHDIVPSPIFGTIEVQPIGVLSGHENVISLMKFNNNSKLLATCSDFDYSVKIWRGSKGATTTEECLDINIGDVKHQSPIISLEWIKDDNLLSISMDGILNVWNSTSGKNLKHCQLFKPENFTIEQEDFLDNVVLVFDAVVSPNGKYLAVGDDYCRITVWDISLEGPKELIGCLAMYTAEIPQKKQQQEEEQEQEQQANGNINPGNVGICDLKWDNESKCVIGSFNGLESVIVSLE